MSPLPRSCVRSISIEAPRGAVFDLVADATTLPAWAPAFARAVRPDGDAWLVDTGDGEVRVRVRASEELGTVDFLAAGVDGDVGAFSRVVPNGDGCEFTFAAFLPPGATDEAVAAQEQTVAAEVEAVRRLAEARAV